MLLDEKRTRLWPAADAEPAQIAAMSVDAHTPLTQPSRERSFAFKVPPEEARKARKVWLYQSEEGSVLPGDIKDAIKRGRELYDLVNRE